MNTVERIVNLEKELDNHEQSQYLEVLLCQTEYQILIVETSSVLELAKAFYHKCNYTKEAVIRDFWTKGNDKVVFWKYL